MESVEEKAGAHLDFEMPRSRRVLPIVREAMRQLDQKVHKLVAASSDLREFAILNKDLENFVRANRSIFPRRFLEEIYYEEPRIHFIRLVIRLRGTTKDDLACLRRRTNRLEKYVLAHKARLPKSLLDQYMPDKLIAEVRQGLPEKPKPTPPKRGSVRYRSWDK